MILVSRCGKTFLFRNKWRALWGASRIQSTSERKWGAQGCFNQSTSLGEPVLKSCYIFSVWESCWGSLFQYCSLPVNESYYEHLLQRPKFTWIPVRFINQCWSCLPTLIGKHILSKALRSDSTFYVISLCGQWLVTHITCVISVAAELSKWESLYLACPFLSVHTLLIGVDSTVLRNIVHAERITKLLRVCSWLAHRQLQQVEHEPVVTFVLLPPSLKVFGSGQILDNCNWCSRFKPCV